MTATTKRKPVHPKVLAATVGGGLGVQLGEAIVEVAHIDGPKLAALTVSAATALVAFLGGYIKRSDV